MSLDSDIGKAGVLYTVPVYWCRNLFSFDCSGALVVEGAMSLDSDKGKARVVFTVPVYWCRNLFSFDCSGALVVEGAMSLDSDIGKAGVVFTVTVYRCLKLVFFWLQWCPGCGGSYEPWLWYREGRGSIYCNSISMSETCSFDCSGALVVEGAKSLDSDIGKAG